MLTRPGRDRTDRLAVLMYHSVGSDKPASLSADAFRKHMAFVAKSHDYQVVDWLHRDRMQPDRPSVLVTFDDGYLDNHEVAAPIVRDIGVPGLFFITTSFVDG